MGKIEEIFPNALRNAYQLLLIPFYLVPMPFFVKGAWIQIQKNLFQKWRRAGRRRIFLFV